MAAWPLHAIFRAVVLAPAPGNFANSCRALCAGEARAYSTITPRRHDAI